MKRILPKSAAVNTAAAVFLLLVFVFAIYAIVGVVATDSPSDRGENMGGTANPEARNVSNSRLFRKNCSVCHTSKKGGRHKIGPNLWAIIGRDKAAMEGYRYSKALSALTGKWTEDEIGRFISDPKAFAPRTKMGFRGIRDKDELRGVIDYLRSLSDTSSAVVK